MASPYMSLSMCGAVGDDSSEEEEIEAAVVIASRGLKRRWGGSVIGHKMVKRDRHVVEKQLDKDYFGEDPIYDEDHFRRRFRMRKSLFKRIVSEVTAANSFFEQRCNAVGNQGFSPLHKCTAALKMLAYGHAADYFDDQYKIAESTVLQTLKEFVKTVISVYEAEYLRPPNEQEIKELLKCNEARGFPGMIGSIDCMHWEWSNCPTAWHGMYKGHKGKPTMILEVVASQDLRIWHAFFGLPGSHNDINVLHRSPVFDDLANGRAPSVEFTVNNKPYFMGYYLADGIYPDWATLVKSISSPVSNKQKIYSQRQEACRKDVERAFGVLRAKWKILYTPARLWKPKDLNSIVRACIILHNIVLEDEKGVQVATIEYSEWPGMPNPPINQDRDNDLIAQLIDAYDLIKDKDNSQALHNDLMEHIWGLYGTSSGPFATRRTAV